MDGYFVRNAPGRICPPPLAEQIECLTLDVSELWRKDWTSLASRRSVCRSAMQTRMS
jgi:hypothetical protein